MLKIWILSYVPLCSIHGITHNMWFLRLSAINKIFYNKYGTLSHYMWDIYVTLRNFFENEIIYTLHYCIFLIVKNNYQWNMLNNVSVTHSCIGN